MCKANHSSSFIAELMNKWNCTSIPHLIVWRE